MLPISDIDMLIALAALKMPFVTLNNQTKEMDLLSPFLDTQIKDTNPLYRGPECASNICNCTFRQD